MVVTLVLSFVMMVGLFLMMWTSVAFIQDKRFFIAVPKASSSAIRIHNERFPGARRMGWRLMIMAIVMMLSALFYAGLDGVNNGFGFWEFFTRYIIMLFALMAFEIIIIDVVHLCNSSFLSHYYPEVKESVVPYQFKHNLCKNLRKLAIVPFAAAALAGLSLLLS